MKFPKIKIPGRHWLMLLVAVALLVVVGVFVDLKPVVSENFFFSSSDPQFQEDAKIDKMFGGNSQMIVSVAGEISSSRYIERIGEMTRQFESIKGVSSADSLAVGPKDFEDAEKSPFWKRLLIADDHKSSNVVVFIGKADTQELIARMQAIIDKHEAKDFRIQIAGAPYVAEMVRRSLKHDFHVFSLTSVLLFGVAMWGLFRSAKLTLGMLVTCTSAVLLTLLVQSLFGQKIGILTANLSTIIFVVTLSHLVYMTFNWQTLAQKGGGGDKQEDGKGKDNADGKAKDNADGTGLGGKAWRMTLPASFWSMVCASLGFASLLLVPAKPLRELGIGGTLGTVVALLCAYLMYPSFLDWAAAKKTRTPVAAKDSGFWQRRFVRVSIVVVAASAGLSLGLWHLNTDPSLMDYFKKGKEPRLGLEYVDRNGGSNPLTIVIAAADGGKLDTKEEYEKMWNLQDALQENKSVGTALSLPVLMDEAHRHPLAFLLSWNHLLDILNEPKHDRVASTFVTKDRTRAAYYLRMNEAKRTKPRVEVVDNLKEIVRKNGFRPVLVGGVYYLQGELAKLVAKSLIKGLFSLMGFFTVIALVVGRNLRTAAAMIFSLALVPICVLGGVGLLHVPVDIISAPATNICIGMAIDSMVHLVFGVRRAKKDGAKSWDAWVAGRKEQWRGIVFSDVVIAAGFAIFALSSFPPTQRFGLVVLAGTLIDILANLFVLPLLGGAEWRRAKAKA